MDDQTAETAGTISVFDFFDRFPTERPPGSSLRKHGVEPSRLSRVSHSRHTRDTSLVKACRVRYDGGPKA